MNRSQQRKQKLLYKQQNSIKTLSFCVFCNVTELGQRNQFRLVFFCTKTFSWLFERLPLEIMLFEALWPEFESFKKRKNHDITLDRWEYQDVNQARTHTCL